MAPIDNYYQIHTTRFKYLLAKIDSLNIPSSAKILDVGCYPPYIFNQLSEKYSVFGISSPLEPFDHSQVKILNLESDPVNFPKNNFDLIIFSEIIEHLSNPVLVLKKLVPLLKKNGYFIITTPNVFRWQNLISLIVGQNIYFPLFQLEQPINFRHQREYSLAEITSLCRSLHLQAVSNNYFIAYPPNRSKNKSDKLALKFVKYLNYLFSLLFSVRSDSLFLLFRK
ncbi:MAG: methyltransferase domain-containing protein [Candidatus Shapirobacteria bacterium]|nr:methyltransferase domain-containing protein [Candidatus Shapirobacteria bacterium]